MKIVLDISPLRTGHKTRGVGTYTRELAKNLKKVDRANTYILTTRPKDLGKIDLIHYPYFDLFFHSLPIKKTTKTIITIHDVIPLIFPRWFKPGIRGRIRFYFQLKALSQVDAVITDSHHSKGDIVKHLHFPAHKIHIIPLAAQDEFSQKLSSYQLKKIKSKYHLPDQYLLYVGDINPHKNLNRLLEAFSLVNSKLPDIKLVLVTHSLSHAIPEAVKIRELINKLNLNKQVKILTSVPLDPIKDLVAIYSLAQAYVHPSLYEGFGLPVLESLAVGTPVVCSAVASLPEVFATSAITIDPLRKEDIAAGILRALNLSPKGRQSLINQGKLQASKFNWRKVALQTIIVYKQVIHDS